MSDELRRVRLNARVDEDIKRAFNREVESKFGKCRPYAGIELEREFRYFLDDGELADLRHAVDRLAEASSDSESSESKEKIHETDRGETTVASHRISEDVRSQLMSVAEDDYRSSGELVEAIMYGYVADGSVVKRLTQKLQEISEQPQPDVDPSMGAKERRTKTIAHELAQSGRGGFTLEEFDEAIEVAQGIGTSDHTREQYLPRVLDELDFTWHPQNPDLLVATESVDLPEVRDPNEKPLLLMDEDDKRLAIKLAAYRAAKDNIRGKAVFSTADAVDVFGGQVRKSTVRPLMREIADTSSGYVYNRADEVLKINQEKIKRHIVENRDTLNIEEEEISTKIGSDG